MEINGQNYSSYASSYINTADNKKPPKAALQRNLREQEKMRLFPKRIRAMWESQG